MLLNWLKEKSAGKYEEHDDYQSLIHDDGDVSTFYKRSKQDDISELPSTIRPIYEYYDGIDLFSNTFQIAAFSKEVTVHGEVVICTLQQLAEQILGLNFPEPVIPFMLEYGDMDGNQWIYAAAVNSNKIYSYDTRDEVYDIYDSVEQILEGWIADIMEEHQRDGFGLTN
jgi:hypothetical protein